jgi:hypothetical protein
MLKSARELAFAHASNTVAGGTFHTDAREAVH